jgi:hypothetical protein
MRQLRHVIVLTGLLLALAIGAVHLGGAHTGGARGRVTAAHSLDIDWP